MLHGRFVELAVDLAPEETVRDVRASGDLLEGAGRGCISYGLLEVVHQQLLAPLSVFQEGLPEVGKGVAKTVDGGLGPRGLADFSKSLWQRAAVGQGAHMGMLRSITQCLFLSAYHGARTEKVMLAGNYHELVGTDLRIGIGEYWRPRCHLSTHQSGTIFIGKSRRTAKLVPARGRLRSLE